MRKSLFTLLIVALLISACGGGAPLQSTPQSTVAQTPASSQDIAATDQARTMASLRKLDDFPLYEMHYFGDYGFAGFLQEGMETDAQTGSRPEGLLAEWACTCFAALNEEGDLIYGRNFDWYVHPALLLFTHPPDAYASVSMVDISYLGFDQGEPSPTDPRGLLDAPYFPFDGMNEYGLAVGIMAVPYADGGGDPDKVTIGSLHAVRLLLDYARDVDEAISLLQDYNIDFEGGPPVHYLISDSSGNAAVVEFISGELSAIRNSEPWQVATNFMLSGMAPEERFSLCRRYRRAYETLEAAKGNISPEQAMTLLDEVSQSGDFPTIWSIAYNLTSGDIRVVVGREYDRVHQFELEMTH